MAAVHHICNCPMVCQPKSAMAAPQRKLETLIQPLKGRQISRTKAYRQSVSQNCALTLYANLCSHLPEEIGLFQGKESPWRHFKIQKPPATLIYAYICPYISKIFQSIWWPSLFNYVSKSWNTCSRAAFSCWSSAL